MTLNHDALKSLSLSVSLAVTRPALRKYYRFVE
jgi:hypothetical protein